MSKYISRQRARIVEFVDSLMDEVAAEAYEDAAKVAEAEIKRASGTTSRVESALCKVIAAAIRKRRNSL